MQATYDAEADALSITLLEGERARTVKVAPGILAHFDGDKRLLELEVLGASMQYAKDVLAELTSPAEPLTLAAAAKEFGLSPSTLRNQVLNGKLPAMKSGRDWVVTRAAMLTYLDNRAPSGRQARKKKARRPNPPATQLATKTIDLMEALKEAIKAPRHPRRPRARRAKSA